MTDPLHQALSDLYCWALALEGALRVERKRIKMLEATIRKLQQQ